VTIEDIVEEIVGEITDETDEADATRQLAGGELFVHGHVSLADLADLGVQLKPGSDAYVSVGGYVLGELGRIPHQDDTLEADGYQIRVERVRNNRIDAVTVRPR